MSDDSNTRLSSGPWFVGAQNDQLFIVAGRAPSLNNDYPDHGASRQPIAKVIDNRDDCARLMAAAPKLRDVALALRQHLALFCGPDDAIAAELFRAADAVLSLATGKEG